MKGNPVKVSKCSKIEASSHQITQHIYADREVPVRGESASVCYLEEIYL